MALDFKKAALIVGVSLTVIVIGSILYVSIKRWEQQSNDIIVPGRFSDPSLKFVAVVCIYILWKNGGSKSINLKKLSPILISPTLIKIDLIKIIISCSPTYRYYRRIKNMNIYSCSAMGIERHRSNATLTHTRIIFLKEEWN